MVGSENRFPLYGIMRLALAIENGLPRPIEPRASSAKPLNQRRHDAGWPQARQWRPWALANWPEWRWLAASVAIPSLELDPKDDPGIWPQCGAASIQAWFRRRPGKPACYMGKLSKLGFWKSCRFPV